MYTAYFSINYKYAGFDQTRYVSKTIYPGEKYHPIEDSALMEKLDDEIQQELNEYFSGEEYRSSESCDIEMYMISSSEYMSKLSCLQTAV